MPPFIPRKRKRSVSPPPEASTPRRRQNPTLFDAVDVPGSTRTLEDNKAFLENIGGDASDSPLSSLSSSEFEDVDISYPRRAEKSADDDDEDIDWEDAIDATTPITPGPEPSGDLEITLHRHDHVPLADSSGKKKGPSKIDRQKRIQTHCMHVQALLLHNSIRNTWVCDKEVQDILVAQLTPGVKKEWERWKAAMGVDSTTRAVEESGEVAQLDEGGRRGRKGKAKEVNQREWGGQAVTVPIGPSDFKGPDPLIRLLRVLCAFWKKKFRITAPGLRKRGYRSLAVLASETKSFQADPHDPFQHGERVIDVKEFHDLAKKCEGSRDLGAQLFTALLKGLGLETRLIASLQPLGFGWSKTEDAVKARAKSYENKSNEGTDVHGAIADSGGGDESASSDNEKEKSAPLGTKGKASSRASKTSKPPQGRTSTRKGARDKPVELSDDSIEGNGQEAYQSGGGIDDGWESIQNAKSSGPSAAVKAIDKDLPFPIYWSEVFSTVSNRYIPVDALALNTIATNADALASFEPRGAKAEKAKQVICYVVAFSSDRTVKDVTIRYLKRHIWPGKTKGTRMPIEKVPVYNRKGKVKRYDEFDWFKRVMSRYKRNGEKRTWIDDLEDQQDLQPMNPVREKKPQGETLQGYKNSADFVLERHLRREEAILPGREHVKIFVTGKGEKSKEEKVYRREDVVSCKTVESWHKEGREVKPGEQAMKRVPVRAVTLNRKREIQEVEAEGGKMMQGLYSKEQTQWIIPPPIVNGVIPKNAYGNMDCFVPSMVPKGAVHIRLRGTAKIARKLEIDYAEAVTGFEFGSQMAVPVIEGIVVAVGNEQVLLDAWYIAEEERRRKEEAKRERIALGMWRKFLMGLRIIERVREDYGVSADDHLRDEVNPFFNKNKKSIPNEDDQAEDVGHVGLVPERDNDELGGGFFPGGMEVSEAGGFIPSTIDEFDGGGGFIADDGDPALGDYAEESTRISAPAPMSLLAAHRRTAPAVSGNSSSCGENEEELDTLGFQIRASQDMELRQSNDTETSQSKGKGKAGRRKVNAKPVKRVPESRRRKAQVPREGLDESESELTEQDSEDSASLDQMDSIAVTYDYEPDEAEDPTPEKKRAVPKRIAARKSETAVRSHYFEHNSDDEDDVDTENAFPKQPSSKRRKADTDMASRLRRTK